MRMIVVLVMKMKMNILYVHLFHHCMLISLCFLGISFSSLSMNSCLYSPGNTFRTCLLFHWISFHSFPTRTLCGQLQIMASGRISSLILFFSSNIVFTIIGLQKIHGNLIVILLMPTYYFLGYWLGWIEDGDPGVIMDKLSLSSYL